MTSATVTTTTPKEIQTPIYGRMPVTLATKEQIRRLTLAPVDTAFATSLRVPFPG